MWFSSGTFIPAKGVNGHQQCRSGFHGAPVGGRRTSGLFSHVGANHRQLSPAWPPERHHGRFRGASAMPGPPEDRPTRASTACRRDRSRLLAGNPGQGGPIGRRSKALQSKGGVVASDALSEGGPFVRNLASGFLFAGLVPLSPANLDHVVAAGSTLQVGNHLG
jgi:hypothetical protein